MKFELKIKNKYYTIEVFEGEGKRMKIKVDNEEFAFKQKEGKEPKIVLSKTSFPKRNFSEKKIEAPIAGAISQIFVKEGDFIKKGKKVLLLSAMKMENEIVSDFAGRIKKILVTEEQKVKMGDTLIVAE